jgi:hypothetical protein
MEKRYYYPFRREEDGAHIWIARHHKAAIVTVHENYVKDHVLITQVDQWNEWITANICDYEVGKKLPKGAGKKSSSEAARKRASAAALLTEDELMDDEDQGCPNMPQSSADLAMAGPIAPDQMVLADAVTVIAPVVLIPPDNAKLARLRKDNANLHRDHDNLRVDHTGVLKRLVLLENFVKTFMDAAVPASALAPAPALAPVPAPAPVLAPARAEALAPNVFDLTEDD